MRAFLRFFCLQTLNYGLVDASYRWIAQGNIPLGCSSGMLYAWLSWVVIRKISSDPGSKSAVAGYVAGGGLGTYLGIVVSRAVTGV
jgi:hypothetical protein